MSPQVLTGIWAALLVFSSLPGVPRIAGVSNHNSALQNLNSGQNYWKRCRVGSWWGPRPVSRLLILTTDPPLVAIWAPGCSGSVSAVPVLSHLFQLGLLLGRVATMSGSSSAAVADNGPAPGGADPGPPPLEVVELWRAGGFCMRCPSRFSRPCPCGCLWHLCVACGMMHQMVARQLEPRVTNNLWFCFLLGAGGREARVLHKPGTAAPGLRLGIAALHSGPASFGGQCRLFSHRKPGFGMVTWAWPGWQTRASGTSPK